ncbi:unnamed protein product [Mycena citricolor]|uniref:Zn(2)-C6 fungal-type domain-containing protein n=1 Tax=Mycena citricolor TaxID=2018698 RepID=A0AAD2K0T4_9AGAR|nr:unnamed protein product [Mycena citricolor]
MSVQGVFAANSFAALPKGKACLNCRRRKIKCDGAQPKCGPCTRYKAFSDCEYGGDGPLSTHVLEEQIAILQARINELEQPASTQQQSRQISPTNTMQLGPLLSYFFNQQISGNVVDQQVLQAMPTDLPFIVLQALVHNFLHNASCFGFFLDAQTFHDAITSPSAQDLPQILLNVMYLWGVHLSNDPRITAYEPAFLAHALKSTASGLSGAHPRTVVYSIQASVLLAVYFFRTARRLEARYHTSVAIATALSAGLNRIRGRAAQGGLALGEVGALEEGERISAFWSAVALGGCWAGCGAMEPNVVLFKFSPSSGAAALIVDTPWPLEPGDYMQNQHLLPAQNADTVPRFLTERPCPSSSIPALRAKASILLDLSAQIGARVRAGAVLPSDTSVSSLSRTIEAFGSTLPPVQSRDGLVIHTLVYSATIKLFEALSDRHSQARGRVLAATRSIVELLVKADLPQLGVIDPILAPLWASAAQVIVSEITRRRAESGDTQSLVEAIGIVVAAMRLFPFPLMDMHLKKLKDACAPAQIFL